MQNFMLPDMTGSLRIRYSHVYEPAHKLNFIVKDAIYDIRFKYFN